MDNEKIVSPEEEAPVQAQEAPAAAEVTAESAPEETTAAPAATEERPQRAPYRQNNAANRKRKKVCIFCAEKVTGIDYKNAQKLRKFISERGKILPRRVMGTCAMHQRQLTTAIKRARTMALLPYTSD